MQQQDMEKHLLDNFQSMTDKKKQWLVDMSDLAAGKDEDEKIATVLILSRPATRE
jgi:hypothetical protein